MLEKHLSTLQDSYRETHVKFSGINALQAFSNKVTKFTTYTNLKELKSFRISEFSDNHNEVFSSLEFNGDDTIFATACSKSIKLFNYNNVLASNEKIQKPIQQITSNSSISSISFNSYFSTNLASGEQNGLVKIWDTSNSSMFTSWKEHTKRVWSVNFSTSNPNLLSSSSDDGCVKVWCFNQSESVTTIKTRANICTVQFNPFIGDQIAFGSSDHNVYYYDLRYAARPLMILNGHKKAVACLQFLTKDEIISSSIDNTLKLWKISNSDTPCERTFSGLVLNCFFQFLMISFY